MADQMDMADVPTSLDLDAILDARWADPSVFSAEEFARAERFWQQRRAEDARLLAVRQAVTEQITAWTGRVPRDVGSLGIQTNLETSDLDLGIGYPVAERDRLMAALDGHATFLGERKTRFDTSRLVFGFTSGGVEIDLSALTEEDFAVACRMLNEIATGMSEPERIAHTWVKYLLRRAGRLEDYAAWKLVTYARFCPEFNWVPIT
ncbi:hypothetical protein AB0D67_32600 [Streptosporangium sp. NPDC048047]|uniref:hypothetical protein n=1 Tax=Streptosporangium sp. NPDC048047 TaxID=3155748 RepID=UPI003431B876